MSDSPAELIVADRMAWRRWLTDHASNADGVWVVLARKGTTSPTSLAYDEALEEAICFGWIDGQLSRRDDVTFRRRFSPRRPSSAWSKRNVEIVERLTAQGRMRPAGLAAVERAKENGTWERAYAGAATIEVPEDFEVALTKCRPAARAFAALDGANRYAVLYRVATARRLDTRARRIEQLVKMLAEGKSIHPTRKVREPGGAE